MLIGGITAAASYYFNYDTSVEIPRTAIMGQEIGGGRVHNIGLMKQQENAITIGLGTAVIGIGVVILGLLDGIGSDQENYL